MPDATLWACNACQNVIAPDNQYADPSGMGDFEAVECPACGTRGEFRRLGGVSR